MSLEPARSSCPLCQETKRRQLFVKDGFPIAACRRCHLVYVDAAMDSAQLQRSYGSDYYGGRMFADYIGERADRIASARTYCDIIRGLQPAGRLLDVGCATGFFLEAASASWDVTGVELSPFAAEYARREFGHDVRTGDIASLQLPDRSFDVVTLWNTIEHMADPSEAIAQVARVAAPGALVILTTGNVRGPMARRDLPNWNLMTPPEHLHFFDPGTITRLLAGAGLSVRRITQDGRVATRGSLVSPSARMVASALGLGNVMTVYARRQPEKTLWPAQGSRLAARLRPVGRV